MCTTTTNELRLKLRNRKYKVTICGFLLRLLDSIKNDISIDLVLDGDNKLFIKLVGKYNSSVVSADDMTSLNDDSTMSSKRSNDHKETNNCLMSINEQCKQKNNHLIDSANK